MISIQQWANWMNKGSASLPYLLLENYKKMHVSDKEMMLLIHIHSFISEGIHFPSIEQLQERMTCSKMELSQMLNRMHKERFMEINSSIDEDGKMVESYSLEPLWEKLFRYLTIGLEEKRQVAQQGLSAWPWQDGRADNEHLEGEMFRRFEQEFGRPLSPMECETISKWLDEDSMGTSMILLALKEAVLSNKLSLRYIDKILLEWQRNGYTTEKQAEAHIQQFRRQQHSPKLNKKERASATEEFPFYNWLEN